MSRNPKKKANALNDATNAAADQHTSVIVNACMTNAKNIGALTDTAVGLVDSVGKLTEAGVAHERRIEHLERRLDRVDDPQLQRIERLNAAAGATITNQHMSAVVNVCRTNAENIGALTDAAGDLGGQVGDLGDQVGELGNQVGDVVGQVGKLSEVDVAQQRQIEHLERQIEHLKRAAEKKNGGDDDDDDENASGGFRCSPQQQRQSPSPIFAAATSAQLQQQQNANNQVQQNKAPTPRLDATGRISNFAELLEAEEVSKKQAQKAKKKAYNRKYYLNHEKGATRRKRNIEKNVEKKFEQALARQGDAQGDDALFAGAAEVDQQLDKSKKVARERLVGSLKETLEITQEKNNQLAREVMAEEKEAYHEELEKATQGQAFLQTLVSERMKKK